MDKALKNIFLIWIFSLGTLVAGTSGKISGKVIDAETNSPLPGVNIIINGTTLGSSTNAEGLYTILNVPPGTHTLTFSMVGFTKSIISNVIVRIDLTTTINSDLQSEVISSEEVVIVAQRPIVARDVSNSQLNISAQTIENLPIQTVDAVLTLQAGIEQGQNGILVRGGSASQTIFMVDGLSQNEERSNIPFTGVSLSSVKEIQIQTGGFNAEYGNLRSGLVNVVTKEGGQNYSFTTSFRISPPSQKHFGKSIFSPYSYFNRPYLDPTVAFTGTANGEWDSYTQRQYPLFEGWNSVSQATLQDNDPTNDLTPEGAKRLYEWQHRRQGDIKKPDYIIDLGFGGPVPFIGQTLGNLSFYFSYFQEQDVFIFPLSRDSYNNNHGQLKLTSSISRDQKLAISALYGETHSVSPYTWTTTPTGRVLRSDFEIANLLNKNSGNSILYMPGYYSPSSIYRAIVSAKFTQVISNNSFYELKVQHKNTNYNTFELPLRDTSQIYEPVPGYFVDEAPYGYWGYGTTGIDGMSIGGWMNLGRDDSKNSTTTLDFDITTQLNQQNELQGGLSFSYNDFDINSGTFSPSFTTWTRSMVYQISPYRAGMYLQDKLEFEGFVMNAGVRFDYSAPNVSWYVLEDYDKNLGAGYGNSLEINSEKDDSKGKLYISPRLGIAHPITDDSKLYFNYGHFRSEAASAYRFRLQRESNGLVTSIGDPTLELEKTIAYELGYSQNLFDLFLLNASAYYKNISNQPGWVYYQNLNSSVQYNRAANNNYEDIRGFELTLSKSRGSWIRGFINYTYHVETSGFFGYTRVYEDPVEQRNFLTQNPVQEKPLPRPFARANIEILSPFEFGPEFNGVYPLEQISINLLAEWKTGRYETYNPNSIPGVQNNVQWVDYLNVDLRLSKVFDLGLFNMQVYLDISNLFNHKQLSYAGFADNFDYNDYLESLNFSWEEGEEKGDDKIGTYRSYNVKYDPLEPNPNNDPDIKNRNDKRKESKSYIDMPNISSFAFLFPRSYTVGLKIDL